MPKSFLFSFSFFKQLCMISSSTTLGNRNLSKILNLFKKILVADSKYTISLSLLSLVIKIWYSSNCYVYNWSGPRIDVYKSLLLPFWLIKQFHTCKIYLWSNYIIKSDNSEKSIESYHWYIIYLLRHFTKAAFQRLLVVIYPPGPSHWIDQQWSAIIWVSHCPWYLNSIVLKSWWNHSLRFPRISGK